MILPTPRTVAIATLAVLATVGVALAARSAFPWRTAPANSSMPAPAAAAGDRLPAPPEPARAPEREPTAPPEAVVSAPDSTIVVTYFHTKHRCPSCLRLEKLAERTVRDRFVRQIEAGRLVWRAVDVDQPHRDHLAREYGLHTKSVVVSEVRGGFEVRWKNLDRAWSLLDDTETFRRYVEQEVRGFLRPG